MKTFTALSIMIITALVIAMISVALPEVSATTSLLPLLPFAAGFMSAAEIRTILGLQPGDKTAINYFDAEMVDSIALATGDTNRSFFGRTAGTTYPVNYGSMPLPFSKFIITGIRFWSNTNQWIQASILNLIPGMVELTKGTSTCGLFSLNTLLRIKAHGGTSATANVATDGYGVTYDTNPYRLIAPITLSDNQALTVKVVWSTAIASTLNATRLACSLHGIAIDKMEKPNS
jgi:hypothetical protein